MGHGHALHYLQRVHDRAGGREEASFLLGLYRDSGFVRQLLAEMKIPDGTGSVALAFADDGPYAVVTRGGAFVTCLERGMRVKDALLVLRGTIDAAFARNERLRERRALARERGLDARRAVEKLEGAGPGLSREDFLGTAGLLGPATTVLMSTYGGCVRDLDESMPLLMQRDLDAQLRREYRREVAGRAWGMAHAAMLHVDNAPREWVEQWAELPAHRTGSPWGPLVTTFDGPLQVRAAWIAGRLGKPLFGFYEARFATAVDPIELLESGWGLLAMGLRHASLRAEAAKALQVAPPLSEHIAVSNLVRVRFAPVGALLGGAADGEAQIVEVARAVGRAEVCRQTSHLEEGSRHRFVDPSTVPEDLALATMLEMPFDGLDLESKLETTFSRMVGAVMACACLPAEAFYLPSAYLHARGAVDLEAVGEALVERRRALLLTDSTVRREGPKVGRNDPCPCGSGKKHKRCCGS